MKNKVLQNILISLGISLLVNLLIWLPLIVVKLTSPAVVRHDLKVGDCTIIVKEPFLGYHALVHEVLLDDKYTVRFCDDSTCIRINKKASDLKKVPDNECDKIR